MQLVFQIKESLADRLRLAALDQGVSVAQAARSAILAGLIRQAELDEVSPEVGGATDAEVEVILMARRGAA